MRKFKANRDAADIIIENVETTFADMGVSLNTVHGFTEVMTDNALFEEYKAGLTQDLDADHREVIGQLLENTRSSILNESTTAGIQPVASLSGKTLRKMFPKIGLTNAIPTEVATSPRFLVSHLLPYILGEDGEQHRLPEALRNPGNGVIARRALSDAPITLPAVEHDLFTPVGASRATGDAVDSDFRIVQVNMQVETEAGQVEDVTVDVNAQVTVDGHLYARVEGKASDGNVVADTITGAVDLKRGILEVACIKGLIKSVVVKGFLTSENNNHTTTVGFEIAKVDVEIPTAEHVDTNLPIEFLEDTKALYGIDGKSESVDLISKVIAQKTELEIIEFIDNSMVTSNSPYKREFDLHPPAMFKGRPKEWVEELKTVIDFLAAEMKNDSLMDEGYFAIIGNPLDTRLIPNVEWSFMDSSTNGQQVAGVSVNYRLGAVSGDNTYQVVASPNVPKGKLRMIFIPTNDRTETYKFYPYSYHVIKDNSYRSPKMPNVPSIMMTKRHRLVEIMPLAAEITITNNDGVLPR